MTNCGPIGSVDSPAANAGKKPEGVGANFGGDAVRAWRCHRLGIGRPDNSPAGTTVATFSVSVFDGPRFAGTLTASPTSTVAISGDTRLVLARADIGG
jgi:hypothetical protein